MLRASLPVSLAAAFGVPAVNNTDYHVLLIGDWGGHNDAEPTTPTQNNAALRMGELTAHLNSQFVVLLGDNFYQHGVTRETADERFTNTFENCFSHHSLQSLPFYAVAGNHDHHGDIQVQMDFTGKGSGRWQMPSLNYNIDKVLPDGKKLRIVMFDSIEAGGMSYMDPADLPVYTGPRDPKVSKAIFDWIERSLAESDADYLFTASHYPVYSGCPHGNLFHSTRLPGLLDQYHATGHLSGHDHCMHHVVHNSKAFVQTGAGSDNWFPFNNATGLADVDLQFHIAADNAGDVDGGFTSMSFSPLGVRFTYYANNGKILFTSDPLPPRTAPHVLVTFV